MQLHDLIERGFVERAAHEPAFVRDNSKDRVFPRSSIQIKPSSGIVKMNLGRANPVFREKLGDRDVMPVLLALEIVLNENDRLLRRTGDTIKPSVRATFLDRRDLDRGFLEARKMNSRLPQEQVGLRRI